jgi:phosphatidate cytidylyltransferase
VWGADIGAYFAGKLFGKNKLAPQLSPGKTIEGAIGGLAAVLLMAGLSVIYEIPGIFLTLYELGGLLTLGSLVIALVALSIMGDLFESQLKRLAGVKDSSNLLPGHGGILDRIDALMPVLPVIAILLIVLAQ